MNICTSVADLKTLRNRECSLQSLWLSLLNLIPTLSTLSRYCHVQQPQNRGQTKDSLQHLLLASTGGELSKHSLPLHLPGLAQRTDTHRGFPQGASLPHGNLLKHRFSINAATVIYEESKEWEEEKKRQREAWQFSLEKGRTAFWEGRGSFEGQEQFLFLAGGIQMSKKEC